jgi:hypothetical protein
VPTDWRWIVCGLLPGSIEGDLLLLALSKDQNFGREMGVAKKKKKCLQCLNRCRLKPPNQKAIHDPTILSKDWTKLPVDGYYLVP